MNKIAFVTGAVIRDDNVKMEDEAQVPLVVFDSSEPPELFCPLCGQFAAGIDNRERSEGGPSVRIGHRCRHLLFVGAYQKFNAQFGVMQPDLKEVFDKLRFIPPPDRVGSKLGVNPENTLVICLQVPYDNEIDNADLVVGFDFTPVAEESESAKRDEVKSP